MSLRVLVKFKDGKKAEYRQRRIRKPAYHFVAYHGYELEYIESITAQYCNKHKECREEVLYKYGEEMCPELIEYLEKNNIIRSGTKMVWKDGKVQLVWRKNQ